MTAEQLETDPYPALAELQATEPVSWLPALGGWMVTSRDLVAQALRDDRTFTVDDPRFTTAAVLGPSMLSLDGPAHRRRRDPFARVLRPDSLDDRLVDFVQATASSLVSDAVQNSDGVESLAEGVELRSSLAAPLAAATITEMLGLDDVTPTEVLAWYRSIVTAVTELTEGRPVPTDGRGAVQQLNAAVARTVNHDTLLAQVMADGRLSAAELASDVGVVLFGAIETTEGMITNAFWHLFTEHEAWLGLGSDRSLIAPSIEESLRLEPAAAVVDRYSTAPIQLGGVELPAGDLVTLSLLAANRDPDHFEHPDSFDINRPAVPGHLAFVHGPHGCIGAGLARIETTAAIEAVLDLEVALGQTLVLDRGASSGPMGLVFRKPGAVVVRPIDSDQTPAGPSSIQQQSLGSH